MKTILFANLKKNFPAIVILFLSIACVSMIAADAKNNKENDSKKKQTINIAIIGASFSGCSVSYFLNKAFEKHEKTYKLNITIFEKNSKLTQNFPTKLIHNTVTDVYYPFIYEWQTNLKKLLNEFQLETNKYNQSSSIGIYDGEEFLVNESNKNLISKLRETYPEDMGKMLTALNKLHKSLQNMLTLDIEQMQVKSLDDFLVIFKNNFIDYKNLFAERTDVFLNNLDINFSFLDKIIRSFLYGNTLKGTDNNAFSSLLAILGQFNNKYYLEKGLVSLVDKLVFDNPYYNINTFLKFGSVVKKIKENKINSSNNYNYNNDDERKTYTITALNEITKETEEYNYFDMIIFSDKCTDFNQLEIIDAEFNKESKAKNFGFSQNLKTVYSHLLLGNIQPSFFYTKNVNEINKKKNDEDKDTEFELLAEAILSNYSDTTDKNFDLNSSNENLAETIMINDNQGFSDFSLIQPMCKNCFLNRFYDENKKKFNSLIRIVSSKEKLSDDFIKKIFNGRVIYESNKGEKHQVIDRKGIKPSDNSNSFDKNNLPEFEICKKRIFNNLAFSYVDDNLEFDLISSKIIASLVLKNYVKDDMDILSSDF